MRVVIETKVNKGCGIVVISSSSSSIINIGFVLLLVVIIIFMLYCYTLFKYFNFFILVKTLNFKNLNVLIIIFQHWI